VADSSISLNDLFDRMFHDSLNPVPLDHRAILVAGAPPESIV